MAFWSFNVFYLLDQCLFCRVVGILLFYTHKLMDILFLKTKLLLCLASTIISLWTNYISGLRKSVPFVVPEIWFVSLLYNSFSFIFYTKNHWSLQVTYYLSMWLSLIFYERSLVKTNIDCDLFYEKFSV